MIAELTPLGEEVKVTLFTVDDASAVEQEKNLKNLENCFQGSGVDFEFEFTDPKKEHARIIETDTGWSIRLDSGLDISQYYDMKNPFELANTIQEYRKCKKFYIVYNRSGNIEKV